MSYLVLARKYRPRTFEALLGQEHVVRALVNALTQQRLHHAYLFTGTRGVGKTTVSRILAKSLNCTGADGRGGITATPCGVCEACRDIDGGRFVDYVELDAASNRGVEEITQLLDQAVYKPVLGRFKVYMIDEVHMLSNHAFNAMLKTLEEPPDYLKFVLATTDPQKVPPTVLSRCLQFNLRPMAPPTVQSHLAAVLAEEDIPAEAGALRLIARAAHGSMRDALSLADQAIAHGAGVVLESGVRQMLGAVDRGHALRLVEALAGRDGAAVVEAVDGLRALGLSASGTLEELAALLQQMALAQVVPQALDSQDPETSEVIRLAGLLASDETQLLYSIVLHGRAELGLAPDEYSGLVMVLLRLLAFAPAGGPERRLAPAPESTTLTRPAPASPARASPASRPHEAGAARIPARAVRGRAVAARAVAASAEAPPRADTSGQAVPDREPAAVRERAPGQEAVPPRSARDIPAELQRTPLGDRWEHQVRALIEQNGVTALARELALQAQCVAVEGTQWTLRVERESLRAPAQCEKLQAALREALGEPVTLRVELGAIDDTPARREAVDRAHRQRLAEKIIHDDPLVQALMKQYSTARIVPGSVKPH
jgi:DNA polymerase-3 subunit gamma/tau